VGQPKFTPQMTLSEWERLFPDDDACKAHLARRRWPEGVRCPRCGSDRVYPLATRPFHWECPDCRKGAPTADPPPLNWSVLRYGFEPEEDGYGEEETHAGRDRRQAAPG
jgi:rubredoxin